MDEDGRAHRRYRNRPRDRGALDQFQQVIRGLAQCDIRVSLEMALRELGPAVPIDDVSQLISAKQARIRLELVESAGADEQLYRAYRLNKQLRLDFKSAPGRECRSIADDLGRGIREAAFYYDKSVADRLPRGLRQAGRQAGQPGRFAVATLRSPESMIYYLGQLARLHNERAGQVGGFDAVPAGNPGPASREERPGETFVIRVSEPRTGAATGGFEVVYEGRS